MAEQDFEDTRIYRVVINHEEQYSIWPADRDCPLGWRDAGKVGTKKECLAYIEEVWTDMRPLSLRREMKKQAENPDALKAVTAEPRPSDPRDDLVAYLSQGDHPVEATATSAEQFLERIESGYVNIKFTDTRGGTELGIKLDTGTGNHDGVNLEKNTGEVHIAGNLTLNYRPVRLTANVALDTLKGFGRLQLTDAGS
jgi:uncharacterized protein YbdZ (MbtH family)